MWARVWNRNTPHHPRNGTIPAAPFCGPLGVLRSRSSQGCISQVGLFNLVFQLFLGFLLLGFSSFAWPWAEKVKKRPAPRGILFERRRAPQGAAEALESVELREKEGPALLAALEAMDAGGFGGLGGGAFWMRLSWDSSDFSS